MPNVNVSPSDPNAVMTSSIAVQLPQHGHLPEEEVANRALYTLLQEHADGAAAEINIPLPAIVKPMCEYNTDCLCTLAFPHLFPWGSGDPMSQTRPTDLGLGPTVLHLMRFHDGRFMSDPRFPFAMLNIILRRKTKHTSEIMVRERMADGDPAEARAKTAEDLLQMMRANPQFKNDLMRYSDSIRGLDSYWRLQKRQLLAMTEQLGPPSLFLTASAADHYWPEMSACFKNPVPSRFMNLIREPYVPATFFIRYERNCVSVCVCVRVRACEATFHNRGVCVVSVNMLHDLACLFLIFFFLLTACASRRTQAFFKHIAPQVLGVTDHFARIEMQHRGIFFQDHYQCFVHTFVFICPHIHNVHSLDRSHTHTHMHSHINVFV